MRAGRWFPKCVHKKATTCARLFYADGSDLVLRQTTEPEDYRHYWHWFQDKRGNYEGAAEPGNDEGCFGYSNLLLHRYSHNASGSPLVKIVLFRVVVKYPRPGVEPMAHYAEQNRLTATPPPLAGPISLRPSPPRRSDRRGRDRLERRQRCSLQCGIVDAGVARFL